MAPHPHAKTCAPTADPFRCPLCGAPVELLLLAALVAAAMLPVWRFGYFPTTDGGAHVANADVLLQYHHPEAGAYRQFYALNHKPVPNAMGHWVLAALMLAFPPLVAEKLLISAYLLLLPLGARYLLRSLRPDAGFLALLVVPLAFNYVLHQGFYNFSTSMAVWCFVVGFYLRRREGMAIGQAIVFAILALLLYCCHQLSFVLAVLTVGVLAGWFSAAARLLPPPLYSGEEGVRGLWLELRRRALPPLLAIVPALLLLAKYRVPSPHRLLALRDVDFWRDLFGCVSLISYRYLEKWPARLFAASVIALVIVALVRKLKRRQWSALDGVALIPAMMLGLYFLHGGREARELFIPVRLILYSYLAALLWLSAQEHAAIVRRLAALAACAVLAALLTIHWPSYAAYDRQLNAFITVGLKMEPRSTLLPLIFASRGQPAASDPETRHVTVAPFFTAAGYVAAQRHAVDLRNYEANTDYFPVTYRPQLNPYRHLVLQAQGASGASGKASSRILDIAAYRQHTGATVDYVLVGAIPPEARTQPATLDLQRQLADGYDPIADDGQNQLWRRKDLPRSK